MKGKWKKAVSYLITIAVTICVCLAIVAVVLRPQTLSIGTVDLNTVADGEYIGVCQNKILFAVVKVEVHDHKITDIEFVEHKDSYM